VSVSSNNLQQATNGSLLFSTVGKEDSGWYLCQSSNGVGQSLSKYVDLVVNGKQ